MRGDSVNVLLVEDDEVDIMNVKRAFRKLNISNPLFITKNGLEALAALRGNGVPKITPRPRIIILDINMPRMNGIEFLRELRSDDQLKSCSVFVLTTSNNDQDIIAAYNLHAAGYIIKPVEPERFIESVSRLNHYWTMIEMP